MPFNPKRYSRLLAAEQRAFERMRVAPPLAMPKARDAYARTSTALACYVARWQPASNAAE